MTRFRNTVTIDPSLLPERYQHLVSWYTYDVVKAPDAAIKIDSDGVYELGANGRRDRLAYTGLIVIETEGDEWWGTPYTLNGDGEPIHLYVHFHNGSLVKLSQSPPSLNDEEGNTYIVEWPIADKRFVARMDLPQAIGVGDKLSFMIGMDEHYLIVDSVYDMETDRWYNLLCSRVDDNSPLLQEFADVSMYLR